MENNNQVHMLHDYSETDDECSIILELPENDPLFNKKKILLESKGFGPNERIRFKSLSCRDGLSATLQSMLRVARIIHLDEVELYFGESSVCLLEDIYSPRNEFKALNSIISHIDILLSGKEQKQTNVLEDVQDAVVNMISDLGGKYRDETATIADYCCGKEKGLLQWGENLGVRTKLQIAYFEGAGRGAVAGENLKVGDVALEIPTSIIISEELVHNSDMYHILEKIEGMSSETMLLLWSMKEKHNCRSIFKIYFDTLPEKFSTGLSFGVDAIMALDGTLLFEEIMQAKEHLRTQYDELFPALSSSYPDMFPPELYSWEQFLWACELWYSNSMKIMFPDGKLKTCLIPVAGFLNHSLHPHIVHYGKVDPTTNSLKFALSRPCNVGEQCCLSYGNYPSSHLITFYGFMPQGDNPYDVIPLDIDAEQAECLENGSFSRWDTHMVRGTWLSKNHEIFHYGLPDPLLDNLRRAYCPMLQRESRVKENLECEIEVIEILRSIFDNMMENLGDSDTKDGEESRWDLKLALKYKDLQRKIVVSIITSCNDGLKLVEKELQICQGCGSVIEISCLTESKYVFVNHVSCEEQEHKNRMAYLKDGKFGATFTSVSMH